MPLTEHGQPSRHLVCVVPSRRLANARGKVGSLDAHSQSARQSPSSVDVALVRSEMAVRQDDGH